MLIDPERQMISLESAALQVLKCRDLLSQQICDEGLAVQDHYTAGLWHRLQSLQSLVIANRSLNVDAEFFSPFLAPSLMIDDFQGCHLCDFIDELESVTVLGAMNSSNGC